MPDQPSAHPPDLIVKVGEALLPNYNVSMFADTPTGCLRATLELRSLLTRWADSQRGRQPTGT